jgi:hypothetical protein
MSALELTQLLDREKIQDCLARLARGEDRRNTELITGAYWPRAIVDLGIFTGSFDEYLAWVVPGSLEIPVTQHVLGQSLISLHTDAAMVETQVLAYHRVAAPDGHRNTVIGGRYVDCFEKLTGEWRISQRTMLYDWCQELGDAADWSAGLMGMPFQAGRYTGSAHGDPSEDLLGDHWTTESNGLAE